MLPEPVSVSKGSPRQSTTKTWGASLAPLLAHRHNRVGRVDDAGDDRGQRLECLLLRFEVFEAVVGAADAGDGVAEAALGDVGGDTGTGEQRAGSTAQIVDRIAAQTRGLVEVGLAIIEAAERTRTVGAENVGAVICCSLQQSLRRLAERDEHVLAALVPRTRDDPHRAVLV